MRVFLCPPYSPQNATCRTHKLKQPTGTPEIDHVHSAVLAAPERHKINLSMTKTALHRTRLRFLDRKNFSVGFFFKTYRQPAPVLAALRRIETEKIEKNFSIFQCYGSG
ncbi:MULTISPECIES: hypothetical protein [unclassified Kosakonia]|uniref:hypothetical protein n=1 Tax=unclassified Kosakonia TaxID=2632876 RepID=UPI0031B70E48